jgi:hypothetical protein
MNSELKYRSFFVLGILHGVWGEFPDDVSGAAVGPETSSGNLYRTPCKIPKTKNERYFSSEFLRASA